MMCIVNGIGVLTVTLKRRMMLYVSDLTGVIPTWTMGWRLRAAIDKL